MAARAIDMLDGELDVVDDEHAEPAPVPLLPCLRNPTCYFHWQFAFLFTLTFHLLYLLYSAL